LSQKREELTITAQVSAVPATPVRATRANVNSCQTVQHFKNIMCKKMFETRCCVGQ